MSRNAVFDAVNSVLSGDAAPPGPDEDLFETGLLDSFKLIALVLHLEERFGVQLTDATMTGESFRTMNRIADLIEATGAVA